jgi:DNA gyrase subunit A
MVKKTLIGELPGPSAQTFTLVRVNEGDALVSVVLTDGKKELLLVTAQGMAIRFSEAEVRPMGMMAAGVSGIKLDGKDEVAGAEVLTAGSEVFLMTTDGKAKRVEQKEFPKQGRYGKGVSAWSLPGKVKIAGVAVGKPNTVATIHLAKAAAKSHRLDEAQLRKRAAGRGDALVELKPGDEVAGVTTGWSVDRFLKVEKEAPKKKAVKGKKSAKAKKARKSVKKKSARAKKSTKKAPAKKAAPAKKTSKKKK